MKPGPLTMVRAVAGATALARLAGAARTRRPVTCRLGRDTSPPSISVVVPARDEAARIGPLLERVVGAPGVAEVVVVDDESTDETASVAARAGAHVVSGRPVPPGWVGKTWAMQQGLEAARGEWIVTLDADTRPDPALPVSVVARAVADGTELLTVAGRFECPTAGSQWLHPAMLTTLVYRFGPPGRAVPPRPDRMMANGQCMAFRRTGLLAIGGFEPVAGEVVEDVALARLLAGQGWRVDFLDAADLLTVRMFESLAETWSGWGRSIALPGVEPRWRQVTEAGVLALALPLPLLRAIGGRADAIDLVLLAARAGTLAGTRRAYAGARAVYWLSPLADPVAVAALLRGALRGRQTWRGRTYVLR